MSLTWTSSVDHFPKSFTSGSSATTGAETGATSVSHSSAMIEDCDQITDEEKITKTINKKVIGKDKI